tara:strand:- start:25412 stop:25732 length:321 start_codon:yes stop_codon:yes gene_type:complete
MMVYVLFSVSEILTRAGVAQSERTLIIQARLSGLPFALLAESKWGSPAMLPNFIRRRIKENPAIADGDLAKVKGVDHVRLIILLALDDPHEITWPVSSANVMACDA